jgi:hypothetical protein
MRFNRLSRLGLLVIALGALVPSQASAASTVTQVASGFDSPRGIAFVDGRIVVAEAGHGGSTCFTPPGAPPNIQICMGDSSRISWVNMTTHRPAPFVTGLFSLSLSANETIGASGLSVGEGRILAQIGVTPQEVPPTFALGQAQAGHLISVNPKNGSWRSVASVGEKDYTYTVLNFTEPTPGVYSPGTNEHDANPYGVLATENGAYVADAGSNTLDFVSRNGKIRILQYFGWRDPNPNNFPSDTVPTCVARSGNALWVGELSGRLNRIVGNNVTQVVPRNSAGQPLLSHVTGCTTDEEGNLYFVNMFGPGIPFTSPSFFQGSVVKYRPNGRASVVAGNLVTPNMAAFGPDGNLYVTAGSTCPAGATAPPCAGGGKVLRINLQHNDD